MSKFNVGFYYEHDLTGEIFRLDGVIATKTMLSLTLVLVNRKFLMRGSETYLTATKTDVAFRHLRRVDFCEGQLSIDDLVEGRCHSAD